MEQAGLCLHIFLISFVWQSEKGQWPSSGHVARCTIITSRKASRKFCARIYHVISVVKNNPRISQDAVLIYNCCSHNIVGTDLEFKTTILAISDVDMHVSLHLASMQARVPPIPVATMCVHCPNYSPCSSKMQELHPR